MAINFLQSYDLQVNEKRGELPVFLCGLPHIARVKYEGSFVLSHKKVLRIFEGLQSANCRRGNFMVNFG